MHTHHTQVCWGGTLFHLDDLPFKINNMPMVYGECGIVCPAPLKPVCAPAIYMSARLSRCYSAQLRHATAIAGEFRARVAGKDCRSGASVRQPLAAPAALKGLPAGWCGACGRRMRHAVCR